MVYPLDIRLQDQGNIYISMACEDWQLEITFFLVIYLLGCLTVIQKCQSEFHGALLIFINQFHKALLIKKDTGKLNPQLYAKGASFIRLSKW